MVSIRSAAEISRGISQMNEIYTGFSTSIENNLRDFEHMGEGKRSASSANAYATHARLEADKIAKKVKKHTRQGKLLVRALRNGSAQEVESIDVNEKSVTDLKSLFVDVRSANNRLELALARAAESPAWANNRAAISYMRSNALSAFLDFERVIKDIVFYAEHYLTDEDCDFDYQPQSMAFSVRDNTISHPTWVKSGEDFVAWLDNLTDEEINGFKH